MNSFGILNSTCKNCDENYFLYKKDYQCVSCNKTLCDSCSSEETYLGKFKDRTCFPCAKKNRIAIRKMIAVENGVIREYNILNEDNSILDSAYHGSTSRAIEHLKYRCLQNGYDAITYLKTESNFTERRNFADLVNDRNKRLHQGYVASGIFVKIEKKS
jgi:hypothetical protein